MDLLAEVMRVFIKLHKGTFKMSIKNQVKAIKRAASKTAVKVPALKVVKVSDTLHKLIAADYRAVLASGRAGVTEYEAFKAVLLATPLNDHKALAAIQADYKKTFGEIAGGQASTRCTMLNNAKKVECGGVVGKQVIKGAGRDALLKAVNSVQSIRGLRIALAAAKPEAMKDSRTKGKPAASNKPKAKPASVNHVAEGVDLPTDRHAAIEAAIKVLEFVATNFLSLTDNGTALTSTYATIKLLKAA